MQPRRRKFRKGFAAGSIGFFLTGVALTTLPSGGGGVVIPGLDPTYDTRFGTATSSDGWFTFDLKPGCRRVWVNAVSGNDANDGLSAATAKKTMDAARVVFIGAGYAPGDQLMVAGGVVAPTMEGPRYPEYTINSNVTGKSGDSLTYPTAMLSYDRNDPTNAAKYGKLVGADMPIIEMRGTTTLFTATGGPTNYMFIQGIEYDSVDKPSTNIFWNASAGGGDVNGIGYQNFRFRGVQVNLQTGDGDPANAANLFGKNFHFSKGSAWGAWAYPDKSQWIYLHGTEDLIIEDCVCIHAGWRMGISRDAGDQYGGPDALSHGMYLSSQNRRPIFRRILYADSPADGFHCRTEATAECLVCLNEPIGMQLGGDVGTTGAYNEVPNGVVITVTDALIGGGGNIRSDLPRGGWLSTRNTIAPTKVSNVALLDNPRLGLVNNNYFGCTDTNPNITPARAFDRIHGYSYATSLFASDSVNTGTFTFTDTILDVLAPGAGNSTYASAPVGNIANDDLPGLMGRASWSDLYNAALWRPDLPWAQALLTIGLPARGLTPTWKAVSPPSMSGITPRGVYAVGLPTNTGLPVITGQTLNGQTLSCSVGTWWNTPDVLSTAYQWKRNGTAISGATASTYTLTNTDIGANITCTVTATNSYGSETVTTTAVGPVTAPSFTFIGLTDNFNDNSLDATKWATGLWYNGKTTTGGTVAETNGRIEITPPVNVSLQGNGLKSLAKWDMTGKCVAIGKVSDVSDTLIGSFEIPYFSVGIDQNHYYAFLKVPGSGIGPLNIVRRNASDVTLKSITYDPAQHVSWMITHDDSDNTVHFWTAPATAANPPAATDWVHQFSDPCDAAVLNPASAQIAFGVWVSGSSPSSNVIVSFDGFNIAA